MLSYAIRIDFQQIPPTDQLLGNNNGVTYNDRYNESGIFILSSFHYFHYFRYFHNFHYFCYFCYFHFIIPFSSFFWLFLLIGYIALQLAIDRTLLLLQTNITTSFNPLISQFDFSVPPKWKQTLSVSASFEAVGPVFIILALYVSIFRYKRKSKRKKE